LVIEQDWFREQTASNGDLYAIRRDEGEVVQIWAEARLATLPYPPVKVGGLVTQFFEEKKQSLEEVVLSAEEIARLPEGEILLLVAPDNLRAYQKWHGEIQAVAVDFLRLEKDYNRRLAGLLDTGYLKNKRVVIVGLGSGGSRIALELAKCGVGNFKLIDFDRLETANLSRHVCGISDLGRFKTRAVADLLRQANPLCRVQTFEFDVLQQADSFAKHVQSADLVISATDSEASKELINRLCWQYKVPSVYGAAYNRAFGGDIVRVIPPETACYHCFHLQLGDVFSEPPEAEKDIDYGSLGDEGKLKGEPGLGLDVGFISLIAARAGLHVLLRGSSSTLEDLPNHQIMWGNRPIWVFEKPLESLFLDLEPHPLCPVCHAENYIRAELGISRAEAQDLAQELIEGAKSFRLPVDRC
jgi:molybdopterin/thiamine biosynthesis adenylyltransferase